MVFSRAITVGNDVVVKVIPSTGKHYVQKSFLDYTLSLGKMIMDSGQISPTLIDENFIEFNIPMGEFLEGDYTLIFEINLDGKIIKHETIVRVFVDQERTTTSITSVSTTTSRYTATTNVPIHGSSGYYNGLTLDKLGNEIMIIDYCNSLIEKDECFFAAGTKKNLYTNCYRISNTAYKERCLMSSLLEGNRVDCDEFIDMIKKRICELSRYK